jgi:hypothetical protein
MVQEQTYNLQDLRHRTQNILQRLKEDIDHLHADITKVDEREFNATAKTATEVLAGLVKAFQDYEKRIWGI